MRDCFPRLASSRGVTMIPNAALLANKGLKRIVSDVEELKAILDIEYIYIYIYESGVLPS